jgi:hypothetical protein
MVGIPLTDYWNVRPHDLEIHRPNKLLECPTLRFRDPSPTVVIITELCILRFEVILSTITVQPFYVQLLLAMKYTSTSLTPVDKRNTKYFRIHPEIVWSS